MYDYLNEISRIGKTIETESRLMFARGWEQGGEVTWNVTVTVTA